MTKKIARRSAQILALATIAFLSSPAGALAQSCGCGDSSRTTAAVAAEETKSSPDVVDTAASAGSFKTLVAAVKAAGLVETLKGKGPFTVFAPTDEAFARIPKEELASLLEPQNKAKLQALLKYHVVAGKVVAADVVKMRSAQTLNGLPVAISMQAGKVMINNANVVKADVLAGNGVIHAVDAVLLPPAPGEAAPMDIVDTAANNSSFSTLVAAVKAAGLVETLKGEGPFTVLAPTNEAFAKLPEGALEELLKPENKDRLIAVLTYHVLPGRLAAAEVAQMTSGKTVNGRAVTIKVAGDAVMVDDAKVVKTDIQTTNGVIHVIDSVILPK